jgi:hypothetical protein
LERIRHHWISLGRTPSLMDIAWFELTPKGVDSAQRIYDLRQRADGLAASSITKGGVCLLLSLPILELCRAASKRR